MTGGPFSGDGRNRTAVRRVQSQVTTSVFGSLFSPCRPHPTERQQRPAGDHRNGRLATATGVAAAHPDGFNRSGPPPAGTAMGERAHMVSEASPTLTVTQREEAPPDDYRWLLCFCPGF